jgi:hypothetical protein
MQMRRWNMLVRGSSANVHIKTYIEELPRPDKAQVPGAPGYEPPECAGRRSAADGSALSHSAPV